jgi:hypothetical protein
MDEIVKKLSERLAEQSSRRGFVAKLSKIALGAGVALAGASASSSSASAADTPDASLACCTGTPGQAIHGPCAQGQYVHYRWFCLTPNEQVVFRCVDCWSSGSYVCTYFSFVA